MIKHAGNIGDGAVRDQSAEGLPEPQKIFGRAKFDMGIGDEREKANLSVYCKKIGVLMKGATQEEAKMEQNLQTEGDE